MKYFSILTAVSVLFGFALSTNSCSNSHDSSFEYLLVKFEGDKNWSLINSDGEVEKRNELISDYTPTLVKEGFFIADSGYYHVDNLKSPAFYDENVKTGTLFHNGTAIILTEYEDGERYFSFIGYDGERNGKGSLARHKVWHLAHDYFYTYDKEGEKVVASMESIAEDPKGNTILGPELTGTVFRNTSTGELIYAAYEGRDDIAEEPVWETTDQLVNFENCWLDGYFIKRTEDGHLVVLDLELNELFSHPEAYTNEQVYHEAYLGDKVIYRADPYNRLYGLMSTDGTVLMQPEYSELYHLGNNVFVVQRNNESEWAGGYLTDEKGNSLTSTKISVSNTIRLASIFKQCYNNNANIGDFYVVSIKNDDGSDEWALIDSKGKRAPLPAKISRIGDARREPLYIRGRIYNEFQKR
ncbi:MAG: hypothetical protein IJ328_07485 [Muribaculaceae bacterium]|nr:hypothetical protein [Muribaculaceae bacterium]